MKIVKGNLIELADAGKFDVICHGANCQNVMGAGIALQIRRRWPAAYVADQATDAKLGNFSQATVRTAFTKQSRRFLTIMNWYTQFMPGQPIEDGEDGVQERLDAIRRCAVYTDSIYGGMFKIGIPAIGCGLAGLETKDVYPIIEQCLPTAVLVEYKP